MADRIKALIGVLAPEPICDECIVERLGLSALHQASQRTRQLALEGGFERGEDRCATCAETRIVTRRSLR